MPKLITRVPNMNLPKFKQSGLSMIELMISIAIGLIVVSGVIGMFVSTVTSNANNLKMTRLNQDLRAVMDIVTRDIRRAGYWGGVTTGAVTALGVPGNINPFRVITAAANIAGTANSCITFSYDYSGNGALDDGSGAAPNNVDERYGFRVNNKAVEVRNGGAACNAAGWQGITDESAVDIVPVTIGGTTYPALEFTVTGKDVDIDGVIPPATIPCAPGVCVGVTTTPGKMTVRDVQVTLSGQLLGDASVARTLKETIRVETDQYTP